MKQGKLLLPLLFICFVLTMYDLILSDTPNKEGGGEIAGVSVSHMNYANGPATYHIA